jgi:pyruvate dehydrogenase E2 component (dihydrolipoamide acetyltransferase)
MSTEITMPKLSDTMEEGILISWKKSPGDRVERGDILAEVETDKATMELEAFASGILLETRAKAGDVVPVGTIIGLIGTESEKTSSATVSSTQKKDVTDSLAADQVGTEKTQVPETPVIVSKEKEGSSVRGLKGPVEEKIDAGVEKASPMVRRMARDSGIDLSKVKGTGPDGRILKEDLDPFTRQAEDEPEEIQATRKSVDSGKAGDAPRYHAALVGGSEPLSRMRAAIARTVAESWRTIPHFTVTMDIDMGAVENVHHGFRAAGEHVSLNDFLIKSVAHTLSKFPRLNASWADDRIEIHSQINVGIAVSVTDGLLVPVVRECEKLSLREIAGQSRDLIDRARTGKIAQGDVVGGTFTISNMGMLGVDAFTAIILPPQVGILAVGAVADAAVVRKGQISVARMMKAVLSADHRVVDGAYGAGFMQELREILENPVRLLV